MLQGDAKNTTFFGVGQVNSNQFATFGQVFDPSLWSSKDQSLSHNYIIQGDRLSSRSKTNRKWRNQNRPPTSEQYKGLIAQTSKTAIPVRRWGDPNTGTQPRPLEPALAPAQQLFRFCHTTRWDLRPRPGSWRQAVPECALCMALGEIQMFYMDNSLDDNQTW